MTKSQLYEIKHLPPEAPFRHKLVTAVKARKGHKCCACGLPIKPGEFYYTIVQGGGGLGSLKFPDHCHQSCLAQYLGKEKSQ